MWEWVCAAWGSNEAITPKVCGTAVSRIGQIWAGSSAFETNHRGMESAREALVKGYLSIPREKLAPLPEDEYYVFDLVGCAIEDESGRSLGEITDVWEMPGSDIYVVRREDGKDIMIPAVRKFVREISIPDKRVVVSGVDAFLV